MFNCLDRSGFKGVAPRKECKLETARLRSARLAGPLRSAHAAKDEIRRVLAEVSV